VSPLVRSPSWQRALVDVFPDGVLSEVAASNLLWNNAELEDKELMHESCELDAGCYAELLELLNAKLDSDDQYDSDMMSTKAAVLLCRERASRSPGRRTWMSMKKRIRDVVRFNLEVCVLNLINRTRAISVLMCVSVRAFVFRGAALMIIINKSIKY
jgi:hypothetical protein